jgi:hypothetical protein
MLPVEARDRLFVFLAVLHGYLLSPLTWVIAPRLRRR